MKNRGEYIMTAAVLGYGTVGSGVVEVLQKNKEEISRKLQDEIEVKYILDLREFPGDPNENLVVHDYQTILDDEEVMIICETMGGVEPAYTFSKKALLKGKSVCTSNKELVAAHGPELIRIARENHCNYMFEASVGGGIPIIRPLNSSLTPEKIEGITGILNGTTNFILTKMRDEGADFNSVLKEAQDMGYAEKNPEADVEGHDAGRKIAILSSLMYGETVKYADVYTEGITKITPVDFELAKQAGYVIKLLAMSKANDGRPYAMVAPFLVSKANPLFAVDGVFNGILVRGNMLGNTMYYGAGAGKLPTASAVVSDVVDCARHKGVTISCNWLEKEKKMNGIEEVSRRFFVRFDADSKSDLEQLKELFSAEKVIESETDGFAFITKNMSEADYKMKAETVDCIKGMIRIEE